MQININLYLKQNLRTKLINLYGSYSIWLIVSLLYYIVIIFLRTLYNKFIFPELAMRTWPNFFE